MQVVPVLCCPLEIWLGQFLTLAGFPTNPWLPEWWPRVLAFRPNRGRGTVDGGRRGSSKSDKSGGIRGVRL
jgi:hypothetical protein